MELNEEKIGFIVCNTRPYGYPHHSGFAVEGLGPGEVETPAAGAATDEETLIGVTICSDAFESKKKMLCACSRKYDAGTAGEISAASSIVGFGFD